MLFTLTAIFAAGLAFLNMQNAGNPNPQPLAQLISDLDTAMPRAHLSEAQKTSLEFDASALKAAYDAKQHDRPVDRSQVVSAVKSLRDVMQSGAFSAEDKKLLSDDISALRKQSSSAQ